MEDEILDYNWVISKEVPLKKEEATLFQEYFNEDSLILAAAMLHDNDIKYHIEVDNPESKNFGNLLHELHIDESQLTRANELLELLINEDEKLIKMELKRRGFELDPPEEEAKDLVSNIVIISIFFIFFVGYQFLKELASF